jgi:hypothetical protein
VLAEVAGGVEQLALALAGGAAADQQLVGTESAQLVERVDAGEGEEARVGVEDLALLRR